MKFPIDKEYITEKELDEYSIICNNINKDYIIENPGIREYCYFVL